MHDDETRRHDDATRDVIDDATRDIIDDATHDIIDDATRDIIDDATRDVIDDATRDIIDDATRDIIDDATRDIIDDATRDIIDDATRDIIDEATDLIDEASRCDWRNETQQINNKHESLWLTRSVQLQLLQPNRIFQKLCFSIIECLNPHFQAGWPVYEIEINIVQLQIWLDSFECTLELSLSIPWTYRGSKTCTYIIFI